MILLETERLQLREYSKEDAAFIYELMNSEGWLTFIGDRNIISLEDAEKYIQNFYLPSYIQNGYGAYIVILKELNKPIGSCGLYKREDLEYPDVGFAFLGSYSGKGYGFEAAGAVLKHAKELFNITTVMGIVQPNNIASIRLLEKLGLKRKCTYIFKDTSEELLLFSTK